MYYHQFPIWLVYVVALLNLLTLCFDPYEAGLSLAEGAGFESKLSGSFQ